MDQAFGALQLSWNVDEVVLKYFLILVWRWFSYRQMKGVPCMCSKGEINLKFHLARLDLLRHLSTLQDFLLNHWRTRAAAPGFIWGFDYVFANLLQRKPVKSSLVYSLSIGNLQHRWPYGGISETKKGAEVSCLLAVAVSAGLGFFCESRSFDGRSFRVSRSCGTGDVYLVHHMMLRSWYLGTETLSEFYLLLWVPTVILCQVWKVHVLVLHEINCLMFTSQSCLYTLLNPGRIGW